MHTDIKAKRGLVEEKLITFVHQQHHTCKKILSGWYNGVFHLGQGLSDTFPKFLETH